MATHSSILCLENPMDTGAWWAIVHGVARVRHDLATKPPPPQQCIERFYSHTFTFSLLYSLNKYLLSIHHLPSTMLDS